MKDLMENVVKFLVVLQVCLSLYLVYLLWSVARLNTQWDRSYRAIAELIILALFVSLLSIASLLMLSA